MAFKYIPDKLRDPWGDPELDPTLGIADRVFRPGDPKPMRWKCLHLGVLYHAWVVHIRAWDILSRGDPLLDAIMSLNFQSFRLKFLPTPILADCHLLGPWNPVAHR